MKQVLDVLACVLFFFMLAIVLMMILYYEKKEKHYKGQLKRFQCNYHLMYSWKLLQDSGSDIASCLKSKIIKSVSIYGMGEIGMLLFEDLTCNGIEVKYIIDLNPEYVNDRYGLKLDGTPVISDLERICELPQIDAMIITTVSATGEVADNLHRFSKSNVPLIPLDGIIDDALLKKR